VETWEEFRSRFLRKSAAPSLMASADS